MELAIKTETIGGATVQTANARELHATLEVGKDFSNWIKAQILIDSPPDSAFLECAFRVSMFCMKCRIAHLGANYPRATPDR